MTGVASAFTGMNHCYDDHRVAMAFSVLGAVVADTVIEEKRCVEETWPDWWDDLENKVSYPNSSIGSLSIFLFLLDWHQGRRC